MSEISKRLLQGTSKAAGAPAALVLEDGAVFRGTSCAAAGEVFGEICFNTSLEGYLEVITDPSYAGQIVTMTYPQIGNYGVNVDDVQADEPALRGLVVRDLCATPSNWRSAQGLPDYLRDHGVVAVEGVDTRALVRHVRDCGAQRAVLSTVDVDEASLLAKVRASASIVGQNMASTVSCARPRRFSADDLPASQAFALAAPPEPRFKVVAYDCGAKRSILENLVRAGCGVTCRAVGHPGGRGADHGSRRRVPVERPGRPRGRRGHVRPGGATAGEGARVRHLPGAPDDRQGGGRGYREAQVRPPRRQPSRHEPARRAAWRSPRRTTASASCSPAWARSCRSCRPAICTHEDDLRCWARRGVAPVVQNERFGRIQLTHVNLNDGTAEGVAFLDIPAFSVQYHPEASPGPTDAHYLFAAFARLMDSAVLANGGVADAAAAAGTPTLALLLRLDGRKSSPALHQGNLGHQPRPR